MQGIRRTAAYIDLGAIRKNFDVLTAEIPKSVKRCLVVKTDGYGHGASQVTQCIGDDADFLAVATAEEAFSLREAGVTHPILVLGYTWEEDFEEMILQGIRPAVSDLQTAKQISEAACRLGKTAKIHIKVDTGMGRIGFLPEEGSVRQVRQIRKLPRIEAEGIFTHLARADETDKSSALKQAVIFRSFIEAVEAGEERIPIHHCANSAAAMEMPDLWMDMVRIGISLYGIYPSDEVDHTRIPLTQAMTWRSEVVLVKEVPAGTGISYGHTYIAPSPRIVATVPVGYGDGYPRTLSGKGFVIIQGAKAPILGRVCMDQMMVDVSDIPGVSRGDTVLLTGEYGGASIPVEVLSELSGRFPYEFVCDVSKRVPRVYL